MQINGSAKTIKIDIIISSLIFLAATAVFFPSWDPLPGLVSDDNAYIGQWARLDCTLDNILFYFKHQVLYLHSPLVMLSFMADKLLWGSKHIFGSHVTNAVLHAFSAVLFYKLLTVLHFFRKGKISLRIPPAAAAAIALLWALHPQRAESVAWACERKDVLVTLFFLGAALSFINAFRKRKFDIAGTILLALSFLCKPMLITFPALAAVFIFCETRGKDFRKKLKYIIPSAAICCLYIIINATQMGKSASNHKLSDLLTVLETAANVGRYFIKTCYPYDLCTWYPVILPYTDALYLLIPASMFLLLKSKWKNFALYCILPGIVMFGIAVSPVSGIISIGATNFADRYSYIPSIFLAAAIAFAVSAAMEKWRYFSGVFYIISGVAVIFFCIETRNLCGIYRDENKFLENALSAENPHHDSLYAFGHHLLIMKRYSEAETLAKNMQIPARVTESTVRHIRTFKKTLYALARIYQGDITGGLPELDKVIFSKDSACLKNFTANFAHDTLLLAARLHLKYNNVRYAAHIFGMLSDFYGEYDPSERDFYLGVRAMIRQEHAEAEMLFARALKAKPGNEKIIVNLKAARAKQGKL